jgi:hypothetical protein
VISRIPPVAWQGLGTPPGEFSDASGEFSDASGDPPAYRLAFRIAPGEFSGASGEFSGTSGEFRDASGEFSDASGDLSDASGDLSDASGEFWPASGEFRKGRGKRFFEPCGHLRPNGVFKPIPFPASIRASAAFKLSARIKACRHLTQELFVFPGVGRWS